MNDDVCQIKSINEKAVKEVKSKMLDKDILIGISDNFKMLGDPTRIQILYALARRELCVCDLTAVLDMSQSAISHQLRLLRTKNMVKFRKEGKMVYYNLADEHVVKFMEMGVSHAREKK
jgi:DNA-binding transcriptional ArsR family regulator